MPDIGEMVLYAGGIYRLSMIITLQDQTKVVLLRRDHWPPVQYILVPGGQISAGIPMVA